MNPLTRLTTWHILGAYLILFGIYTVIHAIVFTRRGIKRRPMAGMLERRK